MNKAHTHHTNDRTPFKNNKVKKLENNQHQFKIERELKDEKIDIETLKEQAASVKIREPQKP